MTRARDSASIDHYLITGFHDLLVQRLVIALARQRPDSRFYVLSSPRRVAQTEAGICLVAAAMPGFPGRVVVVPGDITAWQLGVTSEQLEELLTHCGQVIHMEELCDLRASRRAHHRVNVIGTRHILEFCQRAEVARLMYLSTCYVAGKRTGVVYERELNEGQGFCNVYEETKCQAEIEVRKRMDVIPTTIVRPATVVGDSRSGQPHRYCGPYLLIKLLADLERRKLLIPDCPIPLIGSGKSRIHLVPLDYLVLLIAALDRFPESIGLTYQVFEPHPLRVREIYTLIFRRFGLRVIGSIPEFLVSIPLWLPYLRDWLAPVQSIIPYLNHHAEFDCSNTLQINSRADLSCPRIESYLDVLTDYARGN